MYVDIFLFQLFSCFFIRKKLKKNCGKGQEFRFYYYIIFINIFYDKELLPFNYYKFHNNKNDVKCVIVYFIRIIFFLKNIYSIIKILYNYLNKYALIFVNY